MSETSHVKRRIGLIAGLVFAASLASCAVVPGPYGFPHIVDLTISGSSAHHGHQRGHRSWRRGNRHGGQHRHHRRHRHHRHGGH